MKRSRFLKKDFEPTPSVEYADIVGYARSEFREGRTEKEVLQILTKAGRPREIKGVVHELYLECMEVTLADRVLETIVKFLGLPVALLLLPRVVKMWWAGLVLVVVLVLYLALVSTAFHRVWQRRFRIRLAERRKAN